MSEQATIPAESVGRDARVRLGLVLTGMWLAGGIYYLSFGIGWSQFFSHPIGSMGEFLDGAFAPLAFLWLVLGLFLQQSELAANNRAIQRQYGIMRRSAEQAEIQTRAIAANELHARQDTFIELAKLVGNQLEVVAGLLYLSSQGPPGDGLVSDEEMDEMWGRLASGETSIFSRRMLGLRFRADSPDEVRALFYGTPIRERHCETFIASFERLIRAARGCDPEGMIVDALEGNAQGRLYQIMKDLREGPPAA